MELCWCTNIKGDGFRITVNNNSCLADICAQFVKENILVKYIVNIKYFLSKTFIYLENMTIPVCFTVVGLWKNAFTNT